MSANQRISYDSDATENIAQYSNAQILRNWFIMIVQYLYHLICLLNVVDLLQNASRRFVYIKSVFLNFVPPWIRRIFAFCNIPCPSTIHFHRRLERSIGFIHSYTDPIYRHLIFLGCLFMNFIKSLIRILFNNFFTVQSLFLLCLLGLVITGYQLIQNPPQFFYSLKYVYHLSNYLQNITKLVSA